MDDKHEYIPGAEEEMMGYENEYNPVPEDEEMLPTAKAETHPQVAAYFKGLKPISWIALLLVGIASVFGLLFLFGHLVQITSGCPVVEPIFENCGTSFAEARAKGCIFDTMSTGWMPKACYDADLSELWLERGNYSWYMDDEMKVEVPRERVYAGDYEHVYTSTQYHMAHCSFMWQKIIRRLRDGSVIDEHSFDLYHTDHCAELLLYQQIPLSPVGTKANWGFRSCGPYQKTAGATAKVPS